MPSTRRRPARLSRRAALASALAGILVGAGIVATRFVIDQSEPASLAFLRYSIGLLCLLPVTLLQPWPSVSRRDLLPIGLLGIGQFGILIVLLNYGLTLIPAAEGALIFSSLPLLTLLLAALLGLEALTWLKTGGVFLTILGIGLVLAEKLSSAAWTAAALLGDLAVFASAFTGALCSVLYRPYVKRYAALPVSSLAMAAAVLFLLFLAAWEGFFASWPDFTVGGWLAIVFIGLSSGLGYFLWLWALQHTTPTRVSVFLALNPVTAGILGWLLLGENISFAFFVGMLLVVLGLLLAHREQN